MLNKIVLMGRLTGEPELRHTQNNLPVASFTLAVGRSFSRTGETDFIDIVAWRNQAEFVTKWFHKGMLVAVSGRLQTRNWKDKEGNNRRSFEVMAEEVHFAEPRKNEGGSPSFARPEYSAPSAAEEDSGFRDLSGDDDELPF
jgi:single-strand DNA-binding protein